MGHKFKYLKSFVSRFHREKKIEKMKMIAAFVLLCAVASTQALTWKSCGGDALKIKKLSVTQDPIVFPGPIDAVFEAETTQDMDAAIEVEISMILDTYFSKSGMKKTWNGVTSTTLDGNLKIEGGRLLDFNMETK